jgi:hypothetical protein
VSVKNEGSTEMRSATDVDAVRPLLVPVAIAGAVLTVLAPFTFSAPRSALGVAIGALFAVGNLWAVAVVIRGFLRNRSVSWGALAAVKFTALLFLVGIVLKNQWAEALHLAVGYAALPLGIVFGQLSRRTPAREGR